MPNKCLNLNLDFLPPTAELLCSLPESAEKHGIESLSLRMIDNFPWGFESRLQSGSAYTDGTIDYFFRSCKKHGLAVFFIFPEQGDFVSLLKLNGYRRMAVDAGDIFLINPEAVGFGRFIESVIDDVLSLCPDLASFRLHGPPSGFNKKVAKIIRDSGFRPETIENFSGYDFTHDFLGGEASILKPVYQELKRAENEFYECARIVKKKIVMLSLGSTACSSGGRGIGADYLGLTSSYGLLMERTDGFVATASGIIEPLWLDIYSKSVRLSAEEEYGSIRNRLKQISVLY